ncbi:hypothetical protein A1O3_00570 [Capronia epimyces CBS 606.96]|uniref:aldehyde dehydrogenase (NAD(+)) n=1 Tax=Capronia epimyces CBS 606.96 TaxID=1182542 RepID=W9YQT1_9EURO|nr:uncharacterized protein A1O3_00570 [Capronia epimyces CBS 606.96]EXJ92020.1 hypothetical protein A1O3_00570 [Capronia epimyces CBS 606.96]
MAESEGSPLAFSTSNLPLKLYINGQYVDSKDGKTPLAVYNPKDGTLVSDQVPLAGEKDVEAAVTAAEAAFPAWKKTTANQRRDILLKLASLIEQHNKELARLARLTLGAPWASFGAFEGVVCSETFKYNAGWTDKFAGESFPQENGYLQITRNEPLGVTCGIVPWNGPLAGIALKAAPALATGNCFILKPSEKTPFAPLALGALIEEAGFPPGVFQILSGDGSTGALLASHMRIRKVSFTGSIATGRKIQEMAAKSNLKRVTLELGGKSPAVVFDDCNLDNAVTWCVNAITANSGQVCYAASRIYVQKGIFDKFAAKYAEAMQARANAVGDPDEPSTLLGPVVDKAQFERVCGFIERGIDGQQGKLLVGGKRVTTGNTGSGYFIEPTVFQDVDPNAEIYQNEIFGPVSILNSFTLEEEVVQKANATEYGLMAGVFTQDVNKALRVASEFDSGMVGVNCISLVHVNTPFGGSKASGVGRECGRAALQAFTEPKTIMINMQYT